MAALNKILRDNCPAYGLFWVGTCTAQYDPNPKALPKNGKNYTDADVHTSNGYGIAGSDKGIPVLFTVRDLGKDIIGLPVKGQGIVLKYKVNKAPNDYNVSLAHETGHFAGYKSAASGPASKPGDPKHSPAVLNVMYWANWFGQYHADEDYCQKVTALAK